ncbi:MAG: peptide deformylase [Betaproteobacteria bacterium RIFCSPLOWO2_12_FULL_62_13]|nr:MAG: peptide deformylase [Betaproteobacteria bacterium RIFCSPLOWO2_12_FULL_62_13]
MAILRILRYPDPRLHKVAAKVARVDNEVRKLIKDMAQTMYSAPGIGLAATQVDVHKRVIVIDISETRDQLRAFINPEILEASGEADCEEGCLSVPGIYEKVRRAERVRVRALDLEGKPFTLEAEGLIAACIQHEIDHLEGKVFVEYLSRLKQQRILAKLKKQMRQAM